MEAKIDAPLKVEKIRRHLQTEALLEKKRAIWTISPGRTRNILLDPLFIKWRWNRRFEIEIGVSLTNIIISIIKLVFHVQVHRIQRITLSQHPLQMKIEK